MAASHDSLLGRSEELLSLTRLLDQVVGGTSTSMAVSGEAGIGRSRLLLEPAQTGWDGNWLVLHGRVAEFEGELPFGVVISSFDRPLP